MTDINTTLPNTAIISDSLAWASAQLVDSDSSRLDAELLLAFALDKDRTYLFTWPEKPISSEQRQHFATLIERRMQGEPVAYLMGEQGFWSLTLSVDNSTLIPRPETELLVEIALETLSLEAHVSQAITSETRALKSSATNNINVLDLGTGTGAIGLALALEQPAWQILGVDVNPDAVRLAEHNRVRSGLSNIEFRQSDWFSAIADTDRFDLVVSNPPYIDPDDKHLFEGDVRFEPKTALIAEDHGLADIKHIAENAKHVLRPGGWLMFEHGYDQGADCFQLLERLGYQQITTRKDLGDRDRVTLGCLL